MPLASRKRAGAPRSVMRDAVLVITLAFSLPIAMVLALYAHTMRGLIQGKVISSNEIIISQAADRLRSIMGGAEVTQRLIVSKVVTSPFFGSRRGISPAERVTAQKGLIEYMSFAALGNPSLDGIYLVGEDGFVMSSCLSCKSESILELPWLKSFMASDDFEGVSPAHDADYDSSISRPSYPRVISLLRKVASVGKANRTFVLIVDVLLDPMARELERAGEGGELPLVMKSSDGSFVFYENAAHRAPAATGAIFKVEEGILPGRIVVEGLVLDGGVSRAFFNTTAVSLAVSAALYAACLLGLFAFIKRAGTPVRSLYEAMLSVESGDFSRTCRDSGYREIDYFLRRFDAMVAKIDELMRIQRLKEREALEAERRSLEARVNPHFLYNTLDVMRGMALSNGDREVADMAFALSRMFRYSIKGPEDIVPFSVELEHIMDYLRIQSLRFGGRIRVETEIEPAAADRLVIKLLLQPLVENAFRHGVERRDGSGLVSIRARIVGSAAVIRIEDDGPGFADGEAARLNHYLAAPVDHDCMSSCGGIGSVNMRLRLAFGEKACVRVGAREGGGAAVTAIVPPQRENERCTELL